MSRSLIEFPSKSNSDTEHYFYMFEFYEPGRIDIQLGQSNSGGSNSGLREVAAQFGNNLGRAFEYNLTPDQLRQQIKLPIQSSIRESSAVNYSESELSGANQISSLVNAANQGEGIGRQLGSLAFNELLTQQNGLIGEGAQIAERLSRTARNQFLEVIFQGPSRRKHSFEWTLVARNEQDALNMKDIKRAFQFHMHPDFRNGTTALFSYPNVVKFKLIESLFTQETSETNFRTQTVDKDDTTISAETIFQSKVCVIDSFDVEYGDDKLKFFANDRISLPGIMKLSLNLTEVEYYLKNDFRSDEGA